MSGQKLPIIQVSFNQSQDNRPMIAQNGENDSQKRQSQLWDQIICQTKTAKKILWNWLVILMSCNSLTNFEYEEAFAKPELLKFGKKTSLP